MRWFGISFVAALLAAVPAIGAAGEDIRIANEGGIAGWWRLADGVRIEAPGYPEDALASAHAVCLALGYVIQPDGSTSDHVVVRRWSDAADDGSVAWDSFGQSASRALSQWRFVPRQGAGAARPAFTVATFVFSARQPIAGDLRAHCRVDDVMDAVVTARHAAYERGSLNRQWLDQAYRETMRREIRANQANRCRTSHSMTPNCMD